MKGEAYHKRASLLTSLPEGVRKAALTSLGSLSAERKTCRGIDPCPTLKRR